MNSIWNTTTAIGFLLGFLIYQSLPGMSQGTQSGQQGIQSPGTTTSGSGQDAPEAQTAQVGAGTTSGSTTGSSGPQKAKRGGEGGIDVPPLPRASLCEGYQDTPAYQGCLSIVLRQSRS